MEVDYHERYTALVDRYEELGEQIVMLEQKCAEREVRFKEIQSLFADNRVPDRRTWTV